jgi:hypothetical protein
MFMRILESLIERLGQVGATDDIELASYYRIEHGPRATPRDEVEEIMSELRRAG